nr:crocetin glucosyltransferase 3-like [Oryza sativa Japonica Group]
MGSTLQLGRIRNYEHKQVVRPSRAKATSPASSPSRASSAATPSCPTATSTSRSSAPRATAPPSAPPTTTTTTARALPGWPSTRYAVRAGRPRRGLPDGCESSSDLPLREFITLLFEAFESLEPAFDGFLSGLVDQEGTTVCVVADGFVAWTVGVARRRGCPRTRSSCRAARSARPSSSETTTSEHDAVLSWLDTQRPASVLYISFGSQNSIRLHQTTKSSRRRWSPAAVRSSGPSARRWGSTCINGQFRDEWLPEGFEQRARGHVVHGWAPRVSILAHA